MGNLLVQFVPSPNMAVETAPTNCFTSSCLTPLRLAMGKTVYVTDLTFSTEETHPLTRIFFLIVAFTIALPLTLCGSLVQLCSSSDAEISKQFEKAIDVGDSLKLKENTDAIIEEMQKTTTIPQNEETAEVKAKKEKIARSTANDYQRLVNGFSEMRNTQFFLERALVLSHLHGSNLLGKEDLDSLKPPLSLFSQEQIDLIDFTKPFSSSIYRKPPLSSTFDVLRNPIEASLASIDKPDLRAQAYRMIERLPLSQAILLITSNEALKKAMTQKEVLSDLLTKCGTAFLSSNIKQLTDKIFENWYEKKNFLEDILSACQSFSSKITDLRQSLETSYQIQVEESENEEQATKAQIAEFRSLSISKEFISYYRDFSKAYQTLTNLQKAVQEKITSLEAERTEILKKGGDLEKAQKAAKTEAEKNQIKADYAAVLKKLESLQERFTPLTTLLTEGDLPLLMRGSQNLATLIEKATTKL